MKAIDIQKEILNKKIELLEKFIDRIYELKKEYKTLKRICLHYNIPYESVRQIINGIRVPTIQKLNEFYNLIK